MRVALSLGVFLVVTGVVFALTAHEWRGTVLLLVCAVSFSYVGLFLRKAVREASVPVTSETMAPEEISVEPEHISPTIWPFVFSIAALLLVIGLVVRWVLIPGAILLIGAGAGWFIDIKRQWHPGELTAAHAEGPAAPRSPLEHEEQRDQDDRG
jgi:drug/metabolite transporter (DMT)-like permease